MLASTDVSARTARQLLDWTALQFRTTAYFARQLNRTDQPASAAWQTLGKDDGKPMHRVRDLSHISRSAVTYTRDMDVVDVEQAAAKELPDWEFVFRFSSGRLSLALCATVGERWRRSFERLREPGDLGRWLVESGLLERAPAPAPDRLGDARELREAIYHLVRAAMAGKQGATNDRGLVNQWAQRQPVAPQIGGGGRRRASWPGPDPVAAGLASVAVDAVDLLTSPAIGRVRECAADDCALLFLDSSRPGRRRWCADGACGAKARSAAYRARQAVQRQIGRNQEP